MNTDKSIYYAEPMVIKASQIKVPRDTFQRDAQDWKVKKICDDYNKYLVNRVKVYKSLGYYWAFDGQNTLTVLKKLFGDDCGVPCDLYDINEVQAAELFELQTGYSTKPGVKEKFRSRVFRKDEKTENMIKILKNYGYKLDGNTTRCDSFKSVAALDNFYRKHGPSEFEKVIRVISQSFGIAEGATSDIVFKGISQFIEKFGNNVNEKELIKKLRGTTPEFIKVQSSTHINEWGTNRYIMPIINIYNKNRKEASRVEL